MLPSTFCVRYSSHRRNDELFAWINKYDFRPPSYWELDHFGRGVKYFGMKNNLLYTHEYAWSNIMYINEFYDMLDGKKISIIQLSYPDTYLSSLKYLNNDIDNIVQKIKSAQISLNTLIQQAEASTDKEEPGKDNVF